MNDTQLEALSFDIDGELNRFCLDYGVDPLSMAAVVLARSMLFMREMGSEDEFKTLMKEAILKERYENRSLQ